MNYILYVDYYNQTINMLASSLSHRNIYKQIFTKQIKSSKYTQLEFKKR